MGTAKSRQKSLCLLVVVVVHILVEKKTSFWCCFFYPDSFFFIAGPVIMSIEEKMEADARSIYVGNVCPRALIGVGESSYLGELLNNKSLERNFPRVSG